MERLRFTTVIDASRERVWRTMLEDETYRDWTAVFSPGSHFVGDWTEGSEILFLGPGEDNALSGMVSRIKENRPFEYLAIEHVGLVDRGTRDTTSDAVKAWAGALETYTFSDAADGTEVVVELDAGGEYKAMFEETWPKALARLKTLAEA